jgi:hypothetical protein
MYEHHVHDDDTTDNQDDLDTYTTVGRPQRKTPCVHALEMCVMGAVCRRGENTETLSGRYTAHPHRGAPLFIVTQIRKIDYPFQDNATEMSSVSW